MKNKIFIITPTDIYSDSQGGIKRYILDIVDKLKKSFSFNIIGINLKKEKIIPSKVTTTNTSFIPLIDKYQNRLFIPSTLEFTIKLLLMEKEKLKNNVVHINRTDTILGLINAQCNIILTIHGITNRWQENDQNRTIKKIIWNLFLKWVEKYSIFKSKVIITVDPLGFHYYRKNFKKHVNKIYYIPNGVDVNTFRPLDKKKIRKKYSISINDKVLLFVGRFEYVKGISFLLEVFKKLNTEYTNLKFIFVGSGSKEKLISNVRQKIGKDKIIIFPYISDISKLVEIYNLGDIFLIGSYFEGFPMTALEAQACGVPIVTTNIGALQLLIKDGFNGYVCTKRDVKLFFLLCKKVFQNQSILSKNSRKNIRKFSILDTIKKLQKIYNIQINKINEVVKK